MTTLKPRPNNAVVSAFDAAQEDGRAVLIGYWPAGYPDAETSVRMVAAMVAGGVDMVEIGLPYSDPLMDGPIIAAAADAALASGMNPKLAMRVVAQVAELGVPTLTMTYWNLIEQFGPRDFAKALASAGGVGVITPDLTVEEAQGWIADTEANDVARVFLAAPSSSDERLEVVSQACNGFVYAASLMGVTGTRTTVSQEARVLVERLRGHTRLPISVGLGVSTGAQAREIAAYADGVIVGSAFVRLLAESASADAAAEAVRELAEELSEAVRNPAAPSG